MMDGDGVYLDNHIKRCEVNDKETSDEYVVFTITKSDTFRTYNRKKNTQNYPVQRHLLQEKIAVQ